MPPEPREIVILGGSNGAGKSTAAHVLLPEFLETSVFLNADEIAREFAPDHPESAAMAAGRELLLQMRKLIAQDTSFALETTCSGKSYVKMLQQCHQDGWRITLMYFWLSSPELAIERVGKRVAAGGHGIPQDVIRRRYRLGIGNMLQFYLPLANEAQIYDNSDSDLILVATRSPDDGLRIHKAERWQRILEAGR